MALQSINVSAVPRTRQARDARSPVTAAALQRRGAAESGHCESTATLRRVLTCVPAAAAAFVLGGTQPAALAATEKIGEFGANGLIFKDTVQVMAVDDPGVPGVTLYLSDFKRSVADRLSSGDLFSDPSQTSITCAVTAPLALPGDAARRLGGGEGQEVFSEKKNLSLFNDKTQRVRRIYDPERRALIYVSYSTRTLDPKVTNGRYRTSICAVPLPPPAPSLGTAAPTDAAP